MMISFAHIERNVVDGLITIIKDPMMKHISKLHFKQRLDLFTELLETRAKENEVDLDLIKKLKRIDQLTQTRNMVAHNPLVLEVSQAQDEPPLKEYIGHILKDQKRVTFEQLVETVAELEELESSVYKSLLSIKTNPKVFFLK